ncbi:MAG: TonB-dependent receptor plug domain-containing protein [bacterium]|nr:TonB-dependent receptor plug domain-containing protein [bacterium]
MNVEITTASKKAEKSSDAPGVVSVITAKDIKSFGVLSLVDILQRVPGLQPVGSHLFVQNVASIRGDLLTHSDNHVLLLLNGRPLREGANGGVNSPVYTTFPVEMIERIEIVRGPGSVLYGTNAYAGVINIITKSAPKMFKIHASVGGGSLGGVMGTFSAGLTTGELKVNVSAQYFKEDGWDFRAVTPRPKKPTTTIDMKSGEDKIGVAAQALYKGFHLSAFYSNGSDDVLGTLPYAPFRGKNNLKRLFLDLGYTSKIFGSWDIMVNFTHNMEDIRLNEESETVTPILHYGSDWLGEVSLSGGIGEQLSLVIGGVVDSRHKFTVPENSPIRQTYDQYNCRPMLSWITNRWRCSN